MTLSCYNFTCFLTQSEYRDFTIAEVKAFMYVLAFSALCLSPVFFFSSFFFCRGHFDLVWDSGMVILIFAENSLLLLSRWNLHFCHWKDFCGCCLKLAKFLQYVWNKKWDKRVFFSLYNVLYFIVSTVTDFCISFS